MPVHEQTTCRAVDEHAQHILQLSAGCPSTGGKTFWVRFSDTLGNLDVTFGAGACTLDVSSFIWCGEYRSAVKVST
jgi:hypothetical protein